MEQGEVYQFPCEDPDRWFTSREISDRLGNARGAICRSLWGLRKRKEVHYSMTALFRKGYRCKYKN